MKNLYIILSLAAGLTLSAQDKNTQKADRLFDRFEYVDAASEYQKLVDAGQQDAYVYRRLADSYYSVYNSKEAVRWYAKAAEEPQEAETYYRYSQMLKAEGKYAESNAQMRRFAALAPNDQRAIEFLKDPDYLPRLKNQAQLFEQASLGISSGSSEFGGVLAEDNTFYFASSRNKSRKTYGWNDEPFLDIYRSVYNADGSFSEPVPVEELNTKFHDGPVSVSSDGNTMYFSSESFKEGEFEKDREKKLKYGQVYLYKAVREGDRWGSVKALPFNSPEFSTGNPSLSADGRTLYFASNRPGTLGDSDIWKVSVNGDGGYGEPENLGPRVNTEGNENFPFIAEDGMLYFSSNGRSGLGGLDVFRIDLAGGGEAKNLGEPVNSPKDDFSFSFNVKKNVGFYASNRNGPDRIYQANPVCGVEAIATVKNAKTGEILSGARVAILDEKKNVIETRTSGANGIVSYAIDCDRAYTLQVAKDGFESGTFAVAKTKGGTVNIAADLQPIDVIVTEKEIILKEIFFEFNKSNITQEGAFELDKLVQVMKNNDQMVIMAKGHTDNRGSDKYNLNLSDRRAKATVQYVISKGISAERISGKGYGESEPKVDCKENCTEEEHAQNRRSEFLIIKK